MGVKKLFIDVSEMGVMLMQQHVRTISEGSGRNRVPVYERFEVASEKMGKIEIDVPVEKAIKGVRYGAPVTVENPCVLPRSVVNNINGSKRAKVEFIMTVDELKVQGGTN
ncbi:hypothetical protein ACYSNR_14970 [Enterococcus sp. LJL128]